MINSIKTVGKYLDQPLLVGKLSKTMPAILVGGSALYTAKKTIEAPKKERKKTAINTGLILGATAISALAAPKIAAKVVRKPYETFNIKEIKKGNETLINNFLTKNQVPKEIENILNKGKNKILGLKEISKLDKNMQKSDAGKNFMEKFIPEPQNVTSKDIVKDMGRLSVLGFLPVAGGITGGIVADNITDKPNWKKKVPNKIKEGVYQYLANIFLCNVGAAGALGIMEAANIKSKSARAAGMLGGIVLTGVIGGSKIANTFAQKVINPIFDKKETTNNNTIRHAHNHGKCRNNEDRKPELLDICLHTDDIATIAVMSGFKWIEPSLPILYAISGYRAGIGYRNHNVEKQLNIKA